MRPLFTLTQARSLIPQMLSKLNVTQEEMQLDRGPVRSRSLASHRWRPLGVLFVHLDANVMEACTQELKKAQFTVKSDFVLNLAQSASQLRVQPADVMIIDYPSPACKESQVLQLVHGSVHGLPIIFLTSGMGTESIGALTAEGSFEYVEKGHLAQLPMAVRRVLNQQKLRSELADAKKALRHSQSLHRAPPDNPTYPL